MHVSLISPRIIRPEGRADLRRKKTKDDRVRGCECGKTSLLPIQIHPKPKNKTVCAELFASQASQRSPAEINTFNTLAFFCERCMG